MKAEVGKEALTPDYRADPAVEDQLHEITRPAQRLPRPAPIPRSVKVNASVKDESSLTEVGELQAVEPAPTAAQNAVEPQKRVMATRAALLKVKVGERISVGGRGKFRLLVSALGANRAASILDALVDAASGRGWAIADGEKGFAMVVEDEEIGFMIEEKLRADPHIPTQAELRDQADYVRKCALADRGIGYRPWKEPLIPVYDYVPNGELALKFDENYAYRSERRTFADGKRQRVDTMIDLVLGTLVKYSAAIKSRRADIERQKVQWEEAERKRRQRENQARVEAYRITFLQKQVERHREIEGVEDLISRWEKSDCVDDAFTGILKFARDYRDWLARKLDPADVASRLTELKLMDDDVTIYDVKRIE